MLKFQALCMHWCQVEMQLIKTKQSNGLRKPRKLSKTIKDLCTSTHISVFTDFMESFKLHTDASGIGLRAVLYQEQDGVDRVIRYCSWALSKSEANYNAHKLEFLALKWAVTYSFHEYLYDNTFMAYSDNNPLAYVLSTAKLDITGLLLGGTVSHL